MGVRDTILIGGHTHVSGESTERDPVTGKITFCYQVASFKLVDDYADTLGLMDRHISPAVALVIDPRRDDSDPELVKHFYDPEPPPTTWLFAEEEMTDQSPRLKSKTAWRLMLPGRPFALS